MRHYIGDTGEEPSRIKRYLRWMLVGVMLFCGYLVFMGLYGMKNQTSIWPAFRLIVGSALFVLTYTAHWMLRD